MDQLSWGVMRHGEQSGRRLSASGKLQVTSIGRQLCQLKNIPEDIHIYSSLAFRALDTAELLARVLREVRPGLEEKGDLSILKCESYQLKPDSISAYLRDSTLVLFIGHQPDIENFLELLDRDCYVKHAQLSLSDGTTLQAET